MDKFKNFLHRRRRPLLWTGGVLLLYTLLGFFFVPWFVERQLVNTLQQRLAVTARVEKVRFNPFTFTASIESLSVEAADSSPLLSLNRLYLNLQPLRLFLLKVRLEEITLDTLQLHYTRYSETDDTVSRLAQQWVATAEPDTEVEEEEPPSDELFPLEIGRFQYLNGSIDYRDEVPQTDFATTLGPLNIDIANTSTLADAEERGIQKLVLQIEQDARLTVDGNFDISPLEFTGHVALDNFSLTTPYRYLQDTAPVTLSDGRFATALDYLFRIDDTGIHLDISNLAVQVSALNVIEKATGVPFLTGGTIALENGSFVYPDMRVQGAALRVDGVNLALLRNAQGVVNLQAIAEGFAADEPATNVAVPAPAPAPSSTPLQLGINEITLANIGVNFTDQTPQTDAAFVLQANAELQNFSLVPDVALPFDFAVALQSGGTLTTRGNVQLFPALDLDAMAELADLSLLPLQPYIDEFAQVTLENGSLALAANLVSNSDQPLSYQGDVTLSNFQLADKQRAEKLLSLDTLRADNVNFSLSEKRLDISELIVDAFYGRVLIDENGITNIGQAFTPSTADAASAESSTPIASTTEPAEEVPGVDAMPFAINLGRMQINNASSDFTDLSLPIEFDTKMVALNGEISGFSSTSSQAMTLGLEGQVDEFGLVEISGAMNPMNIKQQTKIELEFTNLKLPSMTPYVIKFAGREIAEGSVDVALAYTIDDSALQASNSVIIRDMRLGGRVDYPDAMDLPLDLAVALLKNREGVIDLDVPITGNVDDPEFDFGPVIRQAIFNVLRNIVTAPFRFLGSLIGGDSEEIDNIRFLPGRDDLAPPEQEKLQQLAMALAERPQLALAIPAPFAAEADTQALQISTVDARIEAQLAQDGSDAQLPERRLVILEALYTTALLTPTLEELRVQFTPVVDPEADEDVEPVFDALAYSASLRERLIAAEPVTEQMLQDLARSRQAAVSAFLVSGGEVTTERLQNQDVATADITDGWLNAMFDLAVVE
ncbi:MAG: DUF748 domain-containing protein [Pseudomonadota bacterium]